MAQDVLQQRKLQMLEKAGIKVLPSAVRHSRSERKGMRAAVMWLDCFGRVYNDQFITLFFIYSRVHQSHW